MRARGFAPWAQVAASWRGAALMTMVAAGSRGLPDQQSPSPTWSTWTTGGCTHHLGAPSAAVAAARTGPTGAASRGACFPTPGYAGTSSGREGSTTRLPTWSPVALAGLVPVGWLGPNGRRAALQDRTSGQAPGSRSRHGLRSLSAAHGRAWPAEDDVE